jgi:hypothetical protein
MARPTDGVLKLAEIRIVEVEVEVEVEEEEEEEEVR